jgi:hypothetical protein
MDEPAIKLDKNILIHGDDISYFGSFIDDLDEHIQLRDD